MPHSQHRARALLAVAGLVLVGSGSAAQAKPSSYWVTPVSGSWYVTGCAPTQPPSGTGFPLTITARCLGEVTGAWTGYYMDDEKSSVDSTLSVRSRGVIALYGKASDGTCGSLRIVTRTVVDGATDAERSTGTIVGGSGDWAGSRGTYVTTGQFDSVEGSGEYHGTWLRPRGASHGRSDLCVPPTPQAVG